MGKKARLKRERGLAPPPVGKNRPKPPWRTPRAAAVAALAVVALAIALLTTLGHGGKAAGAPGPEGVPLEHGPALAAANTMARGKTVDGIACQTSEQVIYHIHAHLTVYVSGQPRSIPLGIGILPPRAITSTPAGRFVNSGACFYWLHVHANDGIIHIESPTPRTYTLGNFFDIWPQPLSSQQVAAATGPVSAYLNGKKYSGNPRTIPLSKHAVIQLDVGTPIVQPRPATFADGL